MGREIIWYLRRDWRERWESGERYKVREDIHDGVRVDDSVLRSHCFHSTVYGGHRGRPTQGATTKQP